MRQSTSPSKRDHMELKSRAEMQLLQAMNHNRARSASGYLREEQEKAEQEEEEQKKRWATQNLKQYRLGGPKNALPPTEEDEMIAAVRQLEHDVVRTKRALTSDDSENQNGENVSQIELNAIQRRERHMDAQRLYTDAVKTISEDIETAIIQAADTIKDTLATIDNKLKRAEQDLANETLLLSSENDQVLQMWESIRAICDERTQAIDRFSARLNAIEQTRIDRVGAGLRVLTKTLMDTAHALPPEVERIIEAEAYELNVVVISNRKAYADLIARLATADVDVLVQSRLCWEKGQDLWRRLRHTDAIQKFHDMMNSTVFMDPPERQLVLAKIRDHQKDIHTNRRLALIQRLQDAGASLSSEVAQDILTQLAATQKEEEDKNAAFFDELRLVHDGKVRDAVGLRETLRLELHGYGALAPEGDITSSRERLIKLLNDESLEDFFRMAGGLKAELDIIVKKLNLAELVYQANLTPLRTSLSVLLSALPLDSVMETQGKGAERKAVQATLEKMRKAGKQEIIQTLPALQTQITMLENLSGMNDVFKAEVEDIGLHLRQIIQEYESLVATQDATSRTSESSGRLSPDKNRTGATSSAPESPPSPSGRTSTAPGSPARSTLLDTMSTSAMSAIDLQSIRKVQRRLGSLMYATELSSAFQTHLRFISEQLEQQTHANTVVDVVISAECEDPLAAREEESKAFLSDIGARIESQSATLHDQSERLAKFFLKVATTMEQSEDRVTYVNLSAMDLLDALKDIDDENNADLERAYSTSSARLRHAPNDIVLQDEFEQSNQLLHDIEASYRLYHKRVTLAAHNHVIATAKQREQFLWQLCELFGLFAPTTPTPFDLDTFLSVKHIENSVSPPEQHGGEGTAPTEGADGHQATGEDSEQHVSPPTTHHDSHTTTKKPVTKGKKGVPHEDTHSAESEHELFTTSSGLQLRIKLSIAELVHFLMMQKQPDDFQTPVSTPRDEEPTMSHDTTPTSSSGEGEIPTEEDPSVAAARIAREERLQRVTDQVRNEFLTLEIPMMSKESLLAGFREAILTKFDINFKAHTTSATEIEGRRVHDCNFLLEERLRMHWPRKGRLDVQCYQPRIGELYSHKQRQERHIRGINKKIETQHAVFEKLVAASLSLIEETRIKQVSLQAQVPMQQSLAALQGLEVKSKKLLSAFRSEIEEKINKLRSMTAADLQMLASSAQEYVRVCSSQLFPDLSSPDVISGYDYHPEEVDALRVKMSEVEDQLKEKIIAREAHVVELVEKQHALLETGKTFKARYQACLQDLSMREGLGQKYGLPRRTAQERYRSETTRSDEASARIDELLATLQSIIESKHVVQSTLKLPEADVATQILHALLRLRTKIYRRGTYFGFLKNVTQLEPTLVSYDSGGVSGRPVIKSDRELVHEDFIAPSTPFLEFVKQVATKCREETRLMYQQEGKLDDLPPSGVPAALEEYLTGQAEKARAYVIQQELKFREQVDWFGELLALAPDAALVDFRERAQSSVFKITRAIIDDLEDKFKGWMEQKSKHMIDLRPDLCSPNSAVQLQALCDRESQRSEQTLAGLRQCRAQVMQTMVGKTSDFEKELLAMCQCFLSILDTSVMTLEDLKPFTGEELPKLKRKSLKRLRKQARIQEFGDAREVKRSDDELKKLTHLGETPRFPKRAWPAIPGFGAHQVWESVRASLTTDDQAIHASAAPDTLLTSIGITKATTDDSTCVSLLTHAHRCLLHSRDETYTVFVEYCKSHSQKLLGDLQERLKDEIKWTESWQVGIDKVRKQATQ